MTIKEDDAVFVDTNVLVYAAVEDSPMHETARKAIAEYSSRSTPMWVSRQVLREYMVIMTRSGLDSRETLVATTLRQVEYFQTHFCVADDSATVTEALLGLVRTIPVAGKQIHDANIVATALAHGIPAILTHNVTDFVRYSDLIDVISLKTFEETP